MRFDFACFALCAIDIEDDLEFDIHEISAHLLSFHTSESDAVAEMLRVTEALRVKHQQRYSRWSRNVPDFVQPQYQVVPIQQMRFEDLSDAQKMIEQAAVLQQKGAGV